MKILKLSVLIALVFVVAGYLIVMALYNYKSKKRPEYQQFAAASMPVSLPDGGYNGTADYSGGWQGKSFDATSSSGINRFDSGERYRFRTYEAKSLTNGKQTVLRIDYNRPDDPLWLRFVVDEVVETGPQLLGKIQIRIIPGTAFTIGYFRLSK